MLISHRENSLSKERKRRILRTNTCTATRVVLVALAGFLGCIASAAADVAPNVGTVLNETQPTELQPPAQQSLGLTIPEDNESAPPTTGGPVVVVSAFQISGQDVVDNSVLLKLSQPSVGKSMTLGELRGVTYSITKYLRAHGYVVARAYIPAQQVANGVVAINVVIGQYGSIELRNTSDVSTRYLKTIIGPLHVGDTIRQSTLERVLLLLTDVSGADVQSTLTAGAAPGTSDLIVSVSKDEKVTGELSADNWGDRYTGRYRAGANLLVNSLTHGADSLNLGYLYSDGGGLNDYDIAYNLPTGPTGAKLSVGYSRLNYELGQNYSSIGATGVADISTLTETYPFVRSRFFNLNGVVGIDEKILQDDISSIDNDDSKRDHIFNVGVTASEKDKDGAGFTDYAVTVSQGALSLDSADASANDTLNTGGIWNKSTLDVTRQQYVASRISYYASFSGQLTDKNLDSSEQIILGGATAVRAYPQGEASGDEGYVATGEIHYDLPTPALQLAGFVDYGSVELDKDPLITSGNTVSLGGAGLGVIARRDGYYLRADYAFKITAYKAISDTDTNGRLWVRLAKDF